MNQQRNERASSLARAALALACVALSAAAADARQPQGPQPAPQTAVHGGAAAAPLSKSYLLRALRRGRPRKSELVRLVEARGVSFKLTAADESRLRAAGATPALLEAARANYRPPSLPAPPVIYAIPQLVVPAPRRDQPKDGGLSDAERKAHPDTFTVAEVTQKAVILSKPEPGYTEEARKNGVQGTVRLRAILTASGKVTNIRVLRGLPDGLSEMAIAAAAQIRFRPAQKDGRDVSQWVLLEYNFNLF
jgi:TonB family protein